MIEAVQQVSRRRAAWVVVVIAAAIVFGIYAAATRGHQFIYDDFSMIYYQQPVQSWADVKQIFTATDDTRMPYYRAVTRLTLLTQKAIHGNEPRAFHLFNAALCGAMMLAVYALLRVKAFDIRPAVALLAAVLFAAHPIMSSCVYPAASGRETLLPAVFMLVSVWAYLHVGVGWYLLAIASFAVALAGKEQAIVLPAAFVLADMLRLNDKGDSLRERWWRYLPLLAMVAGYFWLRHHLFAGAGVKVALFDHPWRPALSMLYGMQMTALPFAQLVYEPDVAQWLAWPRLLTAILLFAAVVWLVLKQSQQVRKTALFWLGFFVLTQLPTANILLQATLYEERYVLLGLLALLAVIASIVNANWVRPGVRRTAIAAGLLLLATAMTVSVHRGIYFRDSLAFGGQWIRTNPTTPFGHHSVGRWYAQNGQLDEGIKHLTLAVQYRPEYHSAQQDLAMALRLKGDLNRAAEHYGKAIALTPDNPILYHDLARVLKTQNRWQDAAGVYQSLLQYTPDDANVHAEIAVAMLNLGRYDQATRHLHEALKLDAHHADANSNLAGLLHQQGQHARALRHVQLALESDPKHLWAWLNQAEVLIALGRLDDAEQSYERAIALSPDMSEAHLALAQLRLSRNNIAGAITNMEHAVRLDGESIEARFNLAGVLAAAGRTQQAVAQYRELLSRGRDHFDLQFQVGLALRKLDAEAATAALRRAAQLRPGAAEPRIALAWMLATHSDANVRDGEQAVALAQQACELTQWSNIAAIDALAAGHAETGQFSRAVEVAEKARSLAEQQGQAAFASAIAERLAIYRTGQPYRDPLAASTQLRE